MSEIIKLEDLTLNIDEARSSSDVVFTKLWRNPELTQIHNVHEGVEMDKYIPILGKFPEMGKLDPGGCAVNAVTSQIPVSQKTWTPKLISGRLAHCQADVPTLLKFWKKARIAANTWEDVDNEMMAFIEDRLTDALYRSILRISSFGDTAASPIGDNTGDENLTAGTAKTLFNMLDGLWKQIFSDQAGTKEAYRFTITANNGVTKVAQLTLADDAAFKILQSMHNNINAEAFEGKPVFQVTKTLYDNYVNYLQKISQNFTIQNMEDGFTNVRMNGVPVIVRYDWDRNIKAYKDLGATYELPHRAILSDINNIPIGTSDTESLTDLQSFYDRTAKTHYIDFAYKIDVKAIVLTEMAVAY